MDPIEPQPADHERQDGRPVPDGSSPAPVGTTADELAERFGQAGRPRHRGRFGQSPAWRFSRARGRH
ncbi:hypothetical protein [Actinomadura kijaniata]|uniref:hypothetical protein n=1 Tax=Actinomadura kijaniata TaxID=46161 RepID=UPI00083548FB|nr:hypothetical protein [Actinomadura kijaniata]